MSTIQCVTFFFKSYCVFTGHDFKIKKIIFAAVALLSRQTAASATETKAQQF